MLIKVGVAVTVTFCEVAAKAGTAKLATNTRAKAKLTISLLISFHLLPKYF
jgi:hypothetical protein